MNNGQPKLQTVKQKLDDYFSRLERYLQTQGVPDVAARHVEHYLNMPRSELRTMTAEMVGEMAWEIYNYNYHLQTIINKNLAKAEKCRAEIERLVGPVMDNYNHIYGKEQKMVAAIMDNDQATKFRETENNCRVVAQRMEYLTARLDNIGRSLLELENSKRRNNA